MAANGSSSQKAEKKLKKLLKMMHEERNIKNRLRPDLETDYEK